MLRYDFQESLGYWLILGHHAYITALTEELAPYGVTYRQAQILGWLACDGPLSQSELAHRMLIEPPSLVGTLDRMEARGLLERRSCPDDRRKNLVHILPASEKIWEHIVAAGRTVRDRATSNLSDEQIASLKESLTTIYHNLARIEDCAGEEPIEAQHV